MPQSLGLIINGARVPVPGVRIVSWLDDPKRAPHCTDGKPRPAGNVSAVVLHTSRGRRGVIREGSRRSDKAERLARYQTRTDRDVSWHLTVAADGEVFQQADLATFMCWQASHANGWTWGVECAQDADTPDLTRAQVDALVAVVAAACDAMGIPRRVPVNADGRPVAGVVKAWQSRKQGGDQKAARGVIGHRNLTTSRGPGDPGDPIFEALLAAGFVGAAPEAMTVGAAPVAAPAEAADPPDAPHDEAAPLWPPLPGWVDPALEIDATEDLPDDLAAFVRDALPQLAALGIAGPRAYEAVAHCATECGRGRRAHGFNMGGAKLKERDNAAAVAATGHGLPWWRDAGHTGSGDGPVAYYRGFDSAAAWWAWFVGRHCAPDAPPSERYAVAGRAFWSSDPSRWFVEILLAGYRGDTRRREVEHIVADLGDVGAHKSVADHRRLVAKVRGIAQAL